MKKIRTGLVGCGSYGRVQLKFLSIMEAFEIISICDVNDGALTSVKDEYGDSCRYYLDINAMLNNEKLDALFISTPNYLHETQTLRAIDKGLAVYVEKPPAITVDGCKKLVVAADVKAVPVMVGMQLRYGNDYRQVKELMDKGFVGNVRMLWYKEFRNPFMGGREDWRFKKETSGGAIIEKNVHQFDLFSWYSGSKPVRISGFGGNDVIYKDKDILDHYCLTIEYANGVKACLAEALFASGLNDENHLYVLGDKGIVIMTDGGLKLKKINEPDFTFLPSKQQYTEMGHAGTEYNAYLAFADYINNGIKPYTGLAEGMESVELSLAAERAIAEGCVIKLD